MADATSTLTLAVNTQQAAEGLRTLTDALARVKGEIAGVNALTTGFQSIQTELSTLKQQMASVQDELGRWRSGMKTTAREATNDVQSINGAVSTLAGNMRVSMRQMVEATNGAHLGMAKLKKMADEGREAFANGLDLRQFQQDFRTQFQATSAALREQEKVLLKVREAKAALDHGFGEATVRQAFGDVAVNLAPSLAQLEAALQLDRDALAGVANLIRSRRELNATIAASQKSYEESATAAKLAADEDVAATKRRDAAWDALQKKQQAAVKTAQASAWAEVDALRAAEKVQDTSSRHNLEADHNAQLKAQIRERLALMKSAKGEMATYFADEARIREAAGVRQKELDRNQSAAMKAISAEGIAEMKSRQAAWANLEQQQIAEAKRFRDEVAQIIKNARFEAAPKYTATGQNVAALSALVAKSRTTGDPRYEAEGVRIFGTSMREAVQHINQFERAVHASGGAHNAARIQRENDAEAIRRWKMEMNEAHSMARGVAAGFQSMWLTWGSVVPLITGFAIATAVRQAVESFAEVQYQMTFIKALTQDASVSVGDMTKQMHELAASLGTSPEEAAKGMRALAQAGLSAQEAIANIGPVMKLAVVGELPTAQAAIAVTGIANAFGLAGVEAEDANGKIRKFGGDFERVGDVLAKAGSMSATSVSGMMESMKIASVIASQYKVNLEELSVILTALAKRNITGTAGGTAAKNMIAEMASPIGQKAKVMDMLGFSAYDKKTGDLKPVLQQIEEMRSALGKFDRMSQDKILRMLFGERGDKAFGALIAQSREDLQKWLKDLQDAGGFTAEVYLQLQRTVKGQFDLMTASIRNAFAEVGEASEGPLIDLMRSIRQAFESEGLRSAIRGLVQSVATLGETLIKYGPYLLGLGTIWLGATTGATLLAGAVRLLTPALMAAQVGITALVTGAAASSVGFKGLLTLIANLNPWVRLASVVMTVAGALFLLRERKESLIQQAQREGRAIDDSTAALKKENEQLEKRIKLREQGVPTELIDQQMALMDKQDKVKQLELGMTMLTFTGKGDSPQFKAMQAELQQETAKLMGLQEEVNNSRKLLERSKKVEAEQAKLALAREMKNRPIGSQHFDEDSLRGGSREETARFRAEKSSILEDYRNAERIAKTLYDTETKLTNELYQNKLISDAEFNRQRLFNERMYQDDVEAAGTKATQRLNAMQSKAARESMQMDLENEKVKITHRNAEQAWMDAVKQGEQQRLALIKEQIDARKFTTIDLPKAAAQFELKRKKADKERDIELLPSGDAAALKAREEVIQHYKQLMATREEAIQQVEKELAAQKKVDDELGVCSQAAGLLEERQRLLKGSLDEATAAMNEQADKAAKTARELDAYKRSAEFGTKSAFAAFHDNATNSAKRAEEFWGGALDHMTDALTTFVMTGKLSFKGLVDYIGMELTRLAVKEMMASMISGGGSSGGFFGGLISMGMNAWAGNWGGVASSVAGWGGSTSLGNGISGGSVPYTPASANGNAFDASRQQIAAFARGGSFTNRVFNTPTHFRYGRGRDQLGVMGEAGPEAIMPLTRDRHGRLGVRLQGRAGLMEVLPLARDGFGRLGVQEAANTSSFRMYANGGAFANGDVFRSPVANQMPIPREAPQADHKSSRDESAGKQRPIQITMHISTPDAGSFRSSQGQVLAEMNRALATGRRNL